LITLIVPIFAFGEPLLFRLTNFRCEFSVIDVCFCSHNGLNSDIAPSPKSAMSRHQEGAGIRPRNKTANAISSRPASQVIVHRM
jgi:hypothetical protein